MIIADDENQNRTGDGKMNNNKNEVILLFLYNNTMFINKINKSMMGTVLRY